jgi:hypothetical protein
MIRFMTTLGRRVVRRDYWLAGQFTRASHPTRDEALATWSELLGSASAELWVAACKSQGQRK